MSQRFGGRFSPDAQPGARPGAALPPTPRHPHEGRPKWITLAATPFLLGAFFQGATGMVTDLAAFGLVASGMVLTREGLVAQAPRGGGSGWATACSQRSTTRMMWPASMPGSHKRCRGSLTPKQPGQRCPVHRHRKNRSGGRWRWMPRRAHCACDSPRRLRAMAMFCPSNSICCSTACG